MRARLRSRGDQCALEHRDLDVFQCRESGHEIKRLKDKADLVGAKVVDVETRQRLFTEKDLALCRVDRDRRANGGACSCHSRWDR